MSDSKSSITVQERRRLRNRRESLTFSFACSRQRYSCTISRFVDGSLSDIFLASDKAGSDSDAAARGNSIVLSIALQFGTPVEVSRHALLRDARCIAISPLVVVLDIIRSEAPTS